VAKAPNEPATYFMNSVSSRSFLSYTILCLLVITPYFWCDSLFMMAFLFLLKKKSEGGISSSEMGVRSLTKIISELGFPRLDCRGVNDVMGVPISVDYCCSVVFEVPAGVDGVEGGISGPCFM
jgi:hypothetical protein